MQQFLPLAHHAKALVVQDELFHWQTVLHRGAHFLHVHQPRCFARDVDHQRVTMRKLNTDRGREAIAHGAQAARGHPAVRILEPEELRRPHLVLTHFGGDVTVHAFGQCLKPLKRVLRFDGRAFLGIGEAADIAPLLNLGLPFGKPFFVGHAATGFPDIQQILKHMGDIADDRNIDADHLVDRGWIDIDMRLGRFRAKGIQTAGDPVVKTGADVDHQIAIMHRHVGLIQTMHTQHAQPLIARRRIGAQPHQGRGDRKAGRFDQFAQQLRCRRARVDDAAAGIENRALGLFHRLDQIGDPFDRPFDGGLIAGFDLGFLDVFAGRELNILWDVDQNRAGAACGRNVKRFVDGFRQAISFLDQPVMLGAGAGDANGVCLLEGVRTDHERRHLTRQNNNRDRIQKSIRQAGHRVCRPRTRGHKTYARFSGGSGIAFGGVHGALFVAHEDMLDVVLLEQFIIDR